MLSFLNLAALLLLTGASADEHHVHKREPGVQYVTVQNTVYVTAGNGPAIPVSTSSDLTSSTATSKTTSVAQVVVSAVSVSSAASSAGASAFASASASASASSSGDDSSDDTGAGSSGALGITYTPYANDGSCKSESQIANDLSKLTGYNVIRLYATDCSQVSYVYKNLASGQKLFLGVYDVSSIESSCQAIADGINNDWDIVHTISIGNELVNSGEATVDQVSSYVTTGRSALRALGYTGPVTTTDTFIAVEDNPGLCDVGDYVTVNAHAFFDSTISASQAGKWLLDTIQAVSATCGGKKTLISESGWPWKGESNGDAVPSTENQQAAIAAIKASCGDDVILFTGFNDLWKSSGAFDAEKYWGLYGDSN